MPMTKAERQELTSLIRKRERVMKIKAQERSAALLAEFDAQSAKIYHFDDDPLWEQAEAEARKAIEEANLQIAARCQQLGIPAEFAPGLSFFWHGRGHNAVADRRTELRRAAKSRIEAIEKEALSKIEALSLQAQTEIIAQGLESDTAKEFLAGVEPVEKLMPPVQFDEIQSLVETRRQQRRLSYDA